MGRTMALPRWLPLLCAALAAAGPVAATATAAPRQSAPKADALDDTSSAAEREWQQITDELTPKLVRWRELPAEQRAKETLTAELARIDGFIKKHEARDPDAAAAARIYLAREVLWRALGRDREAATLLREVAVSAKSGAVAGVAAMNGGEILLKQGDEPGLEALRKLYAARPDADPLCAAALDGLCRQVRLQPGRPFPALELHDLAGRPIEPASLRGKLVVVLAFNVEAPAARGALEQLAKTVAALGDPALQPIGLSLDRDRARLGKVLDELPLKFPVDCAGTEWQSPPVKTLGLTQIPATIVVDPKGTILFSKLGAVAPDELGPLLSGFLEKLRRQGDLPPR
jgi:peroxiredoxin